MAGDTDACAVHQRHNVGDEAPLAFADELAGGIVEEDFAGGAAVDAEFVFESADVDGGAPVADEQAQAQSAGAVGLAASEDEQDFAAAVGDEAFDAVEEPVAVFILKCAELDGLEV